MTQKYVKVYCFYASYNKNYDHRIKIQVITNAMHNAQQRLYIAFYICSIAIEHLMSITLPHWKQE